MDSLEKQFECDRDLRGERSGERSGDPSFEFSLTLLGEPTTDCLSLISWLNTAYEERQDHGCEVATGSSEVLLHVVWLQMEVYRGVEVRGDESQHRQDQLAEKQEVLLRCEVVVGQHGRAAVHRADVCSESQDLAVLGVEVDFEFPPPL